MRTKSRRAPSDKVQAGSDKVLISNLPSATCIALSQLTTLRPSSPPNPSYLSPTNTAAEVITISDSPVHRSTEVITIDSDSEDSDIEIVSYKNLRKDSIEETLSEKPDYNANAELSCVGTRSGIRALKDYPHCRSTCEVFRFIDGFSPDTQLFCKKCFCYVCEVPAAQCKQWARHSSAVDTVESWRVARDLQRRKKRLTSVIQKKQKVMR